MLTTKTALEKQFLPSGLYVLEEGQISGINLAGCQYFQDCRTELPLHTWEELEPMGVADPSRKNKMHPGCMGSETDDDRYYQQQQRDLMLYPEDRR